MRKDLGTKKLKCVAVWKPVDTADAGNSVSYRGWAAKLIEIHTTRHDNDIRHDNDA